MKKASSMYFQFRFVNQRIKLQTETLPHDELRAMPKKYSLSLNEQCFNRLIRGFQLLTKRFFPSLQMELNPNKVKAK